MRYKNAAVQSNIDGLLLDKAVEYFGEEAEKRWVNLAHSIQSPRSLGKSFLHLEADLEWADLREESGVAEKGAVANGRRLQRTSRLSALLEERVSALRDDFNAQVDELRSENEDLKAQLSRAEESFKVREGHLEARNASLVQQMEQLRARNGALGEQLRCTLALHAAVPPTPAQPSDPASGATPQQDQECDSAAEVSPVSRLGGQHDSGDSGSSGHVIVHAASASGLPMSPAISSRPVNCGDALSSADLQQQIQPQTVLPTAESNSAPGRLADVASAVAEVRQQTVLQGDSACLAIMHAQAMQQQLQYHASVAISEGVSPMTGLALGTDVLSPLTVASDQISMGTPCPAVSSTSHIATSHKHAPEGRAEMCHTAVLALGHSNVLDPDEHLGISAPHQCGVQATVSTSIPVMICTCACTCGARHDSLTSSSRGQKGTRRDEQHMTDTPTTNAIGIFPGGSCVVAQVEAWGSQHYVDHENLLEAISCHSQEAGKSVQGCPNSNSRFDDTSSAVDNFHMIPRSAREMRSHLHGPHSSGACKARSESCVQQDMAGVSQVHIAQASSGCRSARPPLPVLPRPTACNHGGSKRGRSFNGRRVEGNVPAPHASCSAERDRGASSCSTRVGVSSAGTSSNSSRLTSESPPYDLEGERCQASLSLPPLRAGNKSCAKSDDLHCCPADPSSIAVAPEHQHSVNLRSGSSSERSASSCFPWILENARARSASVMMRIVSENGVRCDQYLSASNQCQSAMTPRTPAGMPRRLPAKTPDCHREASTDAVRPMFSMSPGHSGLDACGRSADECVPERGGTYSEPVPLHIHHLPLCERANRVLVP